MAGETKTEKADRLIKAGQVVRLQEGRFAITGDSGLRYLTVVVDEQLASKHRVLPGSCTCEARGGCSHLLAARAVERHISNGGEYPAP